ncbi:substrate-binding domain-containing protein [Sinomonas sp. G460-2]|uniref:substrate-binding domain-containing protein n=1 Tax=Sinomonas sp. G460-2 TaxID=3393464 RepID=UPI0039EE9E1A
MLRQEGYKMRHQKKLLAGISALAVIVGLSACGQGQAASGGTADASSASPTIGVLFPDTHTPHWENVMWPSVRDAIKAECPTCKVLYANVAADPTQQENQAQSMLAQGAKALILAPVNSASSTVIVNQAKAQNVPVIGFGSIPEGPAAAFVGIDVTALGQLQGQELLKQIEAGGDPKRGCVIALDGDAQTPASAQFLEGRKSALDSHVNICKETSITNWDPANAQTAMDQAITAVGRDKIIGVYTMDDTIASGAAAAMKAAGFKSTLPPMGGQDADLAAMQRILTGQQSFTLNPRVDTWGNVAGPVALKAARGEQLTSSTTVKNQTEDMPWFATVQAAVITAANMQSAVIDYGLYTFDQICTADYAAACKAAGLHTK